MNNSQQSSTSPMRGHLSDKFKQALKNGHLAKLVKFVVSEPCLDLQIRDNYLNIYYQGGNILRIKPRSFEFNKFYFYLRSEGKDYPKSYIEDISNGKRPKNPSKQLPSKQEADQIISDLKGKAEELLKKLQSDNPNDFFSQAKSVMDNWFKDWKRSERGDQHTISIKNRNFKDSELVVIDLEFAVSPTKTYNNAKNKKGNKKNCKFDIIAVNKDGQIYVIELKENEAADSENNPANINVHCKDFNDTIGKDSDNLFAEEMRQVVEIKKELGVLTKDIKVDTALKPIFAVAFSGKNNKAFNEKYRTAGIKVIEVEKENKKLRLL